jgi:hypothetical protein|tara:strand:+ start:374 stop:601 length:228 start_codon:yes stop_codon:yes gene_type:complete
MDIKQVQKTFFSSLSLKKNGHLIFSLRNQLFDIATLNDYSIKCVVQYYPLTKYSLFKKWVWANTNVKIPKNFLII